MKEFIHYATGGFIPGEALRAKGQKAEFSTLCGRKFPTGGSDIMQSGYTGAKNVTCVDCREKLDYSEKKEKFLEGLGRLILKAI